jgi:hypothetical protein
MKELLRKTNLALTILRQSAQQRAYQRAIWSPVNQTAVQPKKYHPHSASGAGPPDIEAADNSNLTWTLHTMLEIEN